jgi:hypothetical protein
MSKKLIAVASAAALALTGLVGVAPASATAASTAYTAASGSGTADSPYLAAVPHANTLVAGTNALGIVVSNLVAGDTVTVSSAGTAKVVGAGVSASSTNFNVTTLGASTLTKTLSGSSTSATFVVYDTQIANISTITVAISETNSGVKSTSSETKTFKATIGAAHQVTDVVVPSTIAASTAFEVTFKIKDVFGNEIGASGTTVSSALATTAGSPTDSGIATYDTNRKVYVAKMTSPANTDPFIITLDGGTDASSNGLGATSLEGIIRIVNNTTAPATASQISTLTAQVAALTTQLAASVTKKRFNTLARKWNKAFPSQKVALKK